MAGEKNISPRPTIPDIAANEHIHIVRAQQDQKMCDEHREDGVPQDRDDRSFVRLRGHGADVGAHKRGDQQDCDSKHHA